jgi:hypothetical protein
MSIRHGKRGADALGCDSVSGRVMIGSTRIGMRAERLIQPACRPQLLRTAIA